MDREGIPATAKNQGQSDKQAHLPGGAKPGALPGLSERQAAQKSTCGYRLRVGDWRVFFEFDGAVKIISIEEVKKRNEHTY